MESIGELLRTERENKQISLERISRDTNITKKYLEALENDDFSVFPGEPYIIGFLRTFSEYLELDTQKILNLYKNYKIQEQPIPMNELIIKKRPKWPVITGSVMAVIIFMLFLIPDSVDKKEKQKKENIIIKEKHELDNALVYQMDDEILEDRFVEGSQIMIPFNDTYQKLVLSKIDEELSIEISGVTSKLKLGEEKLLDFNGDETNDIKIFLRDIETNERERAVILRFDRFTVFTAKSSEEKITEKNEEPELVKVEEKKKDINQNISIVTEKSNVILSSVSKKPFNFSVNFKGFSLLRYQKDKGVREERYFHKKEEFKIEVEKELVIWASNGGSMYTKVSGKEVKVGKQGEVVAKILRWEYNKDNLNYELRISPLN